MMTLGSYFDVVLGEAVEMAGADASRRDGIMSSADLVLAALSPYSLRSPPPDSAQLAKKHVSIGFQARQLLATVDSWAEGSDRPATVDDLLAAAALQGLPLCIRLMRAHDHEPEDDLAKVRLKRGNVSLVELDGLPGEIDIPPLPVEGLPLEAQAFIAETRSLARQAKLPESFEQAWTYVYSRFSLRIQVLGLPPDQGSSLRWHLIDALESSFVERDPNFRTRDQRRQTDGHPLYSGPRTEDSGSVN